MHIAWRPRVKARARVERRSSPCAGVGPTFDRSVAPSVRSHTVWEARLWQGRPMRHRHRLPQLDAAPPFLADGGLETTLIFHRGLDLPCFAAFDLLRDAGGRDELRAYFAPYLALARERGVGFVLDTATWRANPDWAATARLLARRPRRRQPLGGGPGRGDRRRRRGEGDADRRQRRRRAARRRLRPRGADVTRRGRGLSRPAGRDVRRQRRRHGHRGDDDQRRGGHRHRPRRSRARRPRGDLVHARDRRAPARRPVAARRHRRASTPRPAGRSPTS